jgi:hypothetical protein
MLPVTIAPGIYESIDCHVFKKPIRIGFFRTWKKDTWIHVYVMEPIKECTMVNLGAG